jgi:glutamate synthase (NADPH/NADH) small chain
LEYLVGSDGNLTGLRLAHMRLGEPDRDGRRSPVMIPDSEWVIETDIVIEAIGNRVEEESPAWYPGVCLTDQKLVVVDPETGATSCSGIFAGGDVVRGPSLVIQAVRDGKVGARGIVRFLEEKFNQTQDGATG